MWSLFTCFRALFPHHVFAGIKEKPSAGPSADAAPMARESHFQAASTVSRGKTNGYPARSMTALMVESERHSKGSYRETIHLAERENEGVIIAEDGKLRYGL